MRLSLSLRLRLVHKAESLQRNIHILESASRQIGLDDFIW